MWLGYLYLRLSAVLMTKSVVSMLNPLRAASKISGWWTMPYFLKWSNWFCINNDLHLCSHRRIWTPRLRRWGRIWVGLPLWGIPHRRGHRISAYLRSEVLLSNSRANMWIYQLPRSGPRPWALCLLSGGIVSWASTWSRSSTRSWGWW